MSGTVKPNPNVPPLNQPIADLKALTVVADRMRQGIESLGGTRGDPVDRACTLRDLIKLGLVTMTDLQTALK